MGDGIGRNIARHHGSGTDDRTFADTHPVQYHHLGCQPYIILHANPISRTALFAHGHIEPVKTMVFWDEYHVGGDQAVIANIQPPVTVKNAERANTCARTDTNGTAARLGNGEWSERG